MTCSRWLYRATVSTTLFKQTVLKFTCSVLQSGRMTVSIPSNSCISCSISLQQIDSLSVFITEQWLHIHLQQAKVISAKILIDISHHVYNLWSHMYYHYVTPNSYQFVLPIQLDGSSSLSVTSETSVVSSGDGSGLNRYGNISVSRDSNEKCSTSMSCDTRES